MFRAQRDAPGLPPPSLLAIVVLAAVVKLAHHPLLRVGCLAVLILLGALTVGHFRSRRMWTWWQAAAVAGVAAVGGWWVTGHFVTGIGIPVAVAMLLVAWPIGHRLLRRSPTDHRWSALADRIQTWVFPAAAPPADGPGVAATRAQVVSDLITIFLIALGIRGVWALVVPPWQGPDEHTHYVYTAHIVDQGEIPHPANGEDELPPEVLTSQGLTFLRRVSGVGAWLMYELPYFPVDGAYGAARAYTGNDQQRRSAGPVTDYAPLYYLLTALPYWATRHAPILTRLFALRFTSVLLGALTCLAAYGMAYELRRSRRWGLALGLAMALMPMYAFITSVANSDAALDLLATILVWLMLRTLQRPAITRTHVIALGVTSGAALLTKSSAIILVLAAGVVLLIAQWSPWSSRQQAVRHKLAMLGLFAAGPILLYGPWVALRYHLTREVRLLAVPLAPMIRTLSAVTPLATILSPRRRAASPSLALSVLSPLRYLHVVKDRGGDYFHRLFVESFWGNFGWLDTPLPDRAFGAITVVCVIAAVGLIVQFIVQPARRREVVLLLALIVAQTIFLFIGVDYYAGYVLTGMEFGLQGRYFFPVLAPILYLLLSGWDHLWRERPTGLRIALVGLGVVQLIGLATVASRFYGVGIG